jgi:Heterokaryon incompatibility protein (HET)
MDFGVVDHWIDQCTKNHHICREDGEPWYPSRLIYLTPQDRKAKLIESKEHGPTGRYVTLSHRWGPLLEKMLESPRVQHFQHAIEIGTLPRIFQDAIAIAIRLGAYYIWIDAICIKQGKQGRSDWENEAQKMDKIYSHAFLNISATMSIDGSECLTNYQPSDACHYSEIELQANGTPQNFFVVDGDMWSNEIDNAPLIKRGWVFQERFMARRVLHFGKDQLGWECCQLSALEMFPDGLPRESAMSPIAKPKIQSAMEKLRQNPDRVDDIEFTGLWQILVHQYSKCDLTNAEDKLIAFSGIAKHIKGARDDFYNAGMWKKTMIYDLGWWRGTEVRAAFPISKTSFRAPTWSWASVDGEIIFPSTNGGVRARFVEIEEVLCSTMDRRNALPTGDSIRVKGHCLPLSIERLDGDFFQFSVAGIRFYEGEPAEGSLMTIESSQEEIRGLLQRGGLLLLPLFATSYFMHGIVLTKVRGRCAHRRLGSVEIPVMIQSESTTVERTSGRTDGNKHWECGQQGGWISETALLDDQAVLANRSWSTAAIRLIYLLLDPERTRRSIYIY